MDTCDPTENLVLATVVSLHSELHTNRVNDIWDKIDEKIADVSVTLRAEIAALKTVLSVSTGLFISYDTYKTPEGITPTLFVNSNISSPYFSFLKYLTV